MLFNIKGSELFLSLGSGVGERVELPRGALVADKTGSNLLPFLNLIFLYMPCFDPLGIPSSDNLADITILLTHPKSRLVKSTNALLDLCLFNILASKLPNILVKTT